MSSINDSGENEFAYEESNVVGKSENNPEEEDKARSVTVFPRTLRLG